jgi:hypothetical protein
VLAVKRHRKNAAQVKCSQTFPAGGARFSEMVEPRQKRQRAAASGGTRFYVSRGLPYVTMSEYRERRRDPDARMAVQLSRTLGKLASDFPRFRLALNQLQHHVLVQVRSPAWKARTVLKCLARFEAASVSDISGSCGLDYHSVKATLDQLKTSGQVVPCNRTGKPLPVDHGRKIYWRLNATLENQSRR